MPTITPTQPSPIKGEGFSADVHQSMGDYLAIKGKGFPCAVSIVLADTKDGETESGYHRSQGGTGDHRPCR